MGRTFVLPSMVVAIINNVQDEACQSGEESSGHDQILWMEKIVSNKLSRNSFALLTKVEQKNGLASTCR